MDKPRSRISNYHIPITCILLSAALALFSAPASAQGTVTPSRVATPIAAMLTPTRVTSTPRPANTRTVTPTPLPYTLPQAKSGAVATVNGEIVSWSEFSAVIVLYAPKIEDQLATIKPNAHASFLAQLYKDLLNQLLHEVLLAQAARAAKVTMPENVVNAQARIFLDSTTRVLGAERLQKWIEQAGLTESDWRAAITRIVERELLVNRLTVVDDVRSQDEYDAILNRLLDTAKIVVNDPALATAPADLFRGVFPQPQAIFAENPSGAPPVYVVTERDASGKLKTSGYVFYSTDVAPEERGFAGPIKVLIGMDAGGTITGVKIVSHREPITRLVDDFLAAPSFTAQFKGMHARDQFRVGDDLDGIARATVTANAVAAAVRTSVQRVAAKYANVKPAASVALPDFVSALRVPDNFVERSWVILLLTLLFITLIGFYDKGQRFRYGVMAVAILVLGFGKQDFVSVLHILNLPGTGLPDPTDNLFWYILAAFTLVTTILFGRVYCGYLCPYGMFTELLGRASEQLRRFALRRSNRARLFALGARFVPYPGKIQITPRVQRILILLKYAILAALVAWVLLGQAVEVYHYFEPFATLFFWAGSPVLFGILALSIVGTLYVERFYCKYLCPLGAALGVLAFLAPFRIKRVESCNACKVCAMACPAACSEGKKITLAECYRCGICEEILNQRGGLCRKELGAPVAQPWFGREMQKRA